MSNERQDWPVSMTGGAKIEGAEAARMLGVSKAQLYVLIERGDLQRAEARKKNVRRQPLVFFLKDVVDLALQYETLNEEQAEKLLHPNGAAAPVVAA